MNSNEQIKARYKELYEKMARSKDVRKMHTFGTAEIWAFNRCLEAHPSIANQWLAMLEAGEWNNYLSCEEAQMLANKLINQDGKQGAYWSMEVLTTKLKELGAVAEQTPMYNFYALWMTMNMIYSDHAESIAEDMGCKTQREVDHSKMAASCYRKALEKLCDKDRPSFIRNYYWVELHQ